MVSDNVSIEKQTTPRPPKKFNKRLVFVLTGVIIAVLLGGTWLYLRDTPGDGSPSPVADKPLTQEQIRYNDLITSVVTGDQVQSDAALKNAVDAAGSDEQKANLYLEKAAYLRSTDGISDDMKRVVLADAKTSYSLHKSGAAAKMIVDVATELGDQATVGEYQPILDTYLNEIEDLREGEKN